MARSCSAGIAAATTSHHRSEEAGHALPRLLQAALRFDRTQSEGRAHAQGEGCEVVRAVEIELRAGLREGPEI